MDTLPHSTRSLVHQAISLVEEFHSVRAGRSQHRAGPGVAAPPEEHVKLGWPKPNANCDLAARVAWELVRKGKGRVSHKASVQHERVLRAPALLVVVSRREALRWRA